MDEDEKKKHVPEEFDGKLDCSSFAVCCTFNRCGSLLAVGCNDGRIVVWDFPTRCIAKNIPAHAAHAVTSMSWSRKGHKLASSSLDNSVAIWDVEAGECLIRWVFKAPLMKVQFNPRDDDLLIVCPYKHQSVLLRVECGKKKVVFRYVPTDNEEAEANVITSFDRRGEYIYTGGAKGRLTIMRYSKYFSQQKEADESEVKCEESSDYSNSPPEPMDDKAFEVVSSFKIQPVGSGPTSIRDIEFAPKDKGYFLLNSTDRMVRLYSCASALKAGVDGECEELRKFHETVNKPLWRKCCFSGEKSAIYVCGGSARQHALYIWDITTGAVKKMLQGSLKGESLLDVQWHPSKPIVVSVSGGLVYIWARAEVENWSAYDPKFKELDENQEYDERESEFDIEDEDANPETSANRERASDDDISINVDKIIPEDDDYMSSDEERQSISPPLEYIPISLEDYEMIEAAQPI